MYKIPNLNEIQKVADLHFELNINSCVDLLSFKNKKIFDHGVYAGIDFSISLLKSQTKKSSKHINHFILNKKNELVKLALLSPYKIHQIYPSTFLQDLTDVEKDDALMGLIHGVNVTVHTLGSKKHQYN
jgi:hypothetical protein